MANRKKMEHVIGLARVSAVALLSGIALASVAGCSLIGSANVIENIEEAAGVEEGEPGSVDMRVGDIFDSEYHRVIFICPGAVEDDVINASAGTWQGGTDEVDEWVPPSSGSVEIYRDAQGRGASKYMSSRASLDELDVCSALGGIVAVLPADEQVSFVRTEQGGPWKLH